MIVSFGPKKDTTKKQVVINQIVGFYFIGRGERIRTSDSRVPNAVLYQAELHPDT